MLRRDFRTRGSRVRPGDVSRFPYVGRGDFTLCAMQQNDDIGVPLGDTFRFQNH